MKVYELQEVLAQGRGPVTVRCQMNGETVNDSVPLWMCMNDYGNSTVKALLAENGALVIVIE